jgi:hypothetical protein
VYLFGAFIAVFVWHVVSTLLDRKERHELLDRVMSKNYQEFEYYNKKYPVDVEEVVKVREEAREVRKESPFTEQDFDKPVDDDVKQFLASTETDWNPEEVDVEKLKKMLRSEDDLKDNRG